MVLATNESIYPWMDEGFTSYASSETMAYLKNNGILKADEKVEFPHAGAQRGYAYLVSSGLEEPMTTHGDHYHTNTAYGLASYNKGEVFLDQLEYVVGKENFKKGMLNYFNTWKFKHPNPNDFIRIMEKASDMELDWYKEYFVNSTKSVDYSIKSVEKKSRKVTLITFERKDKMPMPLDFVVYLKKDKKEYFTLPLQIMRGEKTLDNGIKYTVLEDWPWTNPTITVEIATPPLILPKSVPIASSSFSANLDFCKTIPIKINNGTAISILFVIIPYILNGICENIKLNSSKNKAKVIPSARIS